MPGRPLPAADARRAAPVGHAAEHAAVESVADVGRAEGPPVAGPGGPATVAAGRRGEASRSRSRHHANHAGRFAAVLTTAAKYAGLRSGCVRRQGCVGGRIGPRRPFPCSGLFAIACTRVATVTANGRGSHAGTAHRRAADRARARSRLRVRRPARALARSHLHQRWISAQGRSREILARMLRGRNSTRRLIDARVRL
jgi:hypothetical protein